MEFQAFILSLLLLTIVSQTESRSLDTTVQCATTCTDSNSYPEGYTYTYKYEANVASFVESSEDSSPHSTQVLIRADMKVMALSPCEMVLMVSDASISDPSRTMDTTDWTDHVTRNPLHFSWQNGKIPEICASNDDPDWVLNLKRGMLSTLLFPENIQPSQSEIYATMTDVTGECVWEYDFSEERNGIVTASFSKDFNRCEGRNEQLLISHFTKYYSGSDQQSFIKSSHDCERTYSEGRVKESSCTELHTFVPFSKEDSGVRTKVLQTVRELTVRRTYNPDTLGESDIRRTSIVYEKEETSYSSTDISEVEQTIAHVCNTMPTEYYEGVGADFIKMVFLLRRLDSSALGQVYSTLQGACPRYDTEIKSMFLDALQWCGSEGCVVYAAHMIETGELSDAMANRWLTSMSLITKPTIPMLRAMTAIIRSGKFIQKSYLTMGTMINRLSDTVDDCMSDPDVVIALELLEQKLGVNCRTSNPEAKQEILLALRSIGNAGGFTNPTILAQCAQEQANDMETRVAAVQAFRRMPCNTDRSALSQLFFSHDEDSELRIASYVALMECPTPNFIKQAIAMLDNEPILQVASFVWSNMHELMESTDPLKGYIKPFLLEAAFAKKYDLDPRKYSRFYETTIFSDSLKAGATVDGSLVWSPKSFVPRSASMDLSLDVFGQAVNLFEVGGRVEGVETMLQSFLGPNGFLKDHPVADLFTSESDDEDDSDLDDGEEEDEPQFRVSRSSSDARLRDIKSQHEGRVHKEDKPSASMFMRLFGNEMFYKNTHGMQDIQAAAGAIQMAPLMARLAQGSEYKYHDDMMLMNSAHMIPTSAGLPLTLAFNGTASIDVAANGRLDMTQLFTSAPSVDILGSITPRGVVLVTGAMSVDSHVTRTGIATTSSAISSWTLGGKLLIQKGNSIQVKVDAPYERNTVFSFSHKLLKISGDDLVDPRAGLLGLARIESKCSNELGGQRLCISNSMSSQTEESYILPIRQPVEIKVYLEKMDTGFDHYLFQANYHTEYSQAANIPTSLNAEISMDTPSSTVNRLSSATIMYNLNTMEFNFGLQQPTSRISIQGNVENQLTRKALTVRYNKNNQETTFTASFEKQQELTESRWMASSSLQMPSKEISGNALLILDPTKKALFNITINNLMASPISLGASLTDSSETHRNRLKYAGKGKVKLPGLVDSGFSFDVNIKPKFDSFSFRLGYEFSGYDEQNIVFIHKRRTANTADTTHWEAKQKFSCSQYSLINHNVEYVYTNGPAEIRSYVKIGVGHHAGHNDNRNFVSLNQTYTKTNAAGLNRIHGSAELLMPAYDVNYSGAITHEYNSKQFTTTVNYNDYHGLLTFIDRRTPDSLLDLYLRAEFPTMWGQIIFIDTLQEPQPSMYHLNHQLQIDNTQGLRINSDVYLDLLPELKRFEVQSVGSNGDTLFHLRSIFRYLTNGFTTQHSLVSDFNNLVNISITHENEKQGGFETNVMALYEPNLYAELNLDFEKNETGASQKVRVDYQDEIGRKRFLQLLLDSAIQATTSKKNYIGKFAFDTNSRSIFVSQVSGQADMGKSLNAKSAHITLSVNNEEILGGEASHSYVVAEQNSGLTTISSTVRQKLIETAPRKMTATTTVHNTINSGHTITLSYVENNIQKFQSNLQLSADKMLLTGDANQQFTTEIPAEMSLRITRTRNSLDTVVTMDGRSASLDLLQTGESSIRATWRHNLYFLTRKQVPASATGELHWGRRYSDDGKGLWFTSTIDGQDFAIELMYYSAMTSRVNFMVQNQVSLLQGLVPEVDSMFSYQIGETNGHLQFRTTINSEEKVFKELIWQPTRLDFTVRQNIAFITRQGVPQLIKFLIHATSFSLDNCVWSINTDVDQVHSELVFTSNPSVLSLRYGSNDPIIGGDSELAIQKSTMDGAFTLSYTRNGVEKTASVKFDGDRRTNTYGVTWKQDIFAARDNSWLPRSGRSMISYTLEDTTFSLQVGGNYNGIGGSVSTTLEYPISRQRGLLSLSVQLAQNITNLIPDVQAKILGKTDYTNDFFASVKYTIGSDRERSVRARVHFEKSPQEISLTGRFNHNLVELRSLGIPQGIVEEFTITPSGKGYMVSLTSTINNEVKQLAVIGGFDTISNTLKLGFAHEIPELLRAGVPSNVTLITSGSYQFLERQYTLNGDASFQLDDQIYTTTGMTQVAMGDGEVTLTVDLLQDTPLVSLGVPKHIHKVSTLNYGLLNTKSTSGALQLNTVLDRTFVDPNTGLENSMQNRASATINIELFNWHVSFLGSHDFDFKDIPHNIEYDIIISGSASGSPVLHKAVAMSITLDGVKQSASVTLNQNFARNSFYFSSKHNVSKILQYGIPGNMSISFQKNGDYDADLAIIYDTNKKSVGFQIDYDGNQKKAIFRFNHNFDVIVQYLRVPKSVGLEGQFLPSPSDLHSSLTYQWGDEIRYGKVDTRWSFSSVVPDFNLKMKHNFTTDEYFPNITLAGSMNFNGDGYSLDLRTTRGKAGLSCTYSKVNVEHGIDCRLRQNFDRSAMPGSSQLAATASYENGRVTSDVQLTLDRDLKLHTQVSGGVNVESWTADISITNNQQFTTSDVFPVDLTLNSNAAINNGLQTSVTLTRSGQPDFTVSVDLGYDLEAKTATLELAHSQNSWRKMAGIPKRMRITGSYASTDDSRMVRVVVKRGRQTNNVNLAQSFSMSSDMVYGKLMYSQDFTELPEQVPKHAIATAMLGKTTNSFFGQVNVTLDDVSLKHAVEASYNKLAEEVSSEAHATLDNVYLQAVGVPTTMGASLSAQWASGISSSVNANYDDKRFSVALTTDKATRAELSVSQNLDFQPNNVQIVVTRNGNQATMAVSIDGQTQDIVLSGNYNNQQGQLQFSHGFANTPVPMEITLGGSYRTSPDFHVSADAIVDSKQYSVSGGFEKLENGFRFSSSLIDDVSRSATFRRKIVPGGFSVDLEHTIPELENYVPRSVGVSAGLRLNPRPNITASYRQNGNTQAITAEADVKALQFALKHDIELLPIPRSIAFKASGGMNPLRGYFKLDLDETTRSATVTVDPDNYMASLLHSIPELPLPESLSVELSGTAEPLSGTVRLVVNGIEKKATAQLDRSQMRASVRHNMEPLTLCLIPRDLVVGLKGSMEPLSGEVYISIDGQVRNIGGSANKRRGILNLFHSVPEAPQYIPKNITLSVSGSAQPLQGSITLTMDDVQMAGEISTRSPFMALTHSVPQLDTYIPNNLRVTAGFTAESAHATVAYTKQGVSKNVQVSTNFNANHFRVNILQDVIQHERVPSEFSLDLSGSLEFYNFTAATTIDRNFFVNVNGHLMTGSNSDNWFGVSLSAQHNYVYVRDNYELPNDMQVVLKGRKNGESYEAATILNLFEGHDFQAVASVTPRMDSDSMSLSADYTHQYSSMERSVSGQITLSREDGYSITFNGVQTRPEERHVSVSADVQVQRWPITLTGNFEASHNIPELNDLGVPRTISNGVLSFTTDYRTLNESVRLEADGQTVAAGYEYSTETVPGLKYKLNEKMYYTLPETGSTQYAFNYTISRAQDNSWFLARVQSTSSKSRQQGDLKLKLFADSLNPRVTLRLKNPDLQARGVPVNSELRFLRRPTENGIDLSLDLRLDDEALTTGIIGRKTEHGITGSSYFDQNIAFLTELGVPTRLAQKTSENFIFGSGGFDLDVSLGFEYNQYSLWYNLSESVGSGRGSLSHSLTHNVPVLEKYLGCRSYVEKYSYTYTSSGAYSLNGRVDKDGVQVGTYTLRSNGISDVSYTSRYDEKGYDFDCTFSKSAAGVNFLVKLDNQDANIYKLSGDFSEGRKNGQLKFDLYDVQFDNTFAMEKNDEGCSCDLHYTLAFSGHQYSSTLTARPVTDAQEYKGGQMDFSYSVDQQPALTMSLTAKNLGWSVNVEGTMTNDHLIKALPQRSRVNLLTAPSSYDFGFNADRMRITSQASYQLNGGDLQADWNLNQNVLRPSYPREFTATVAHTQQETTARVTVDQVSPLTFNVADRNIELRIKDLSNSALFTVSGNYVTEPSKQINLDVVSAPLSVNLHVAGTLSMFQKTTGNSTASLSVENLNTENSAHVTAYIHPSGGDALNFNGGIFAFSDMEALPFTYSMSLKSAVDSETKAYKHYFQSSYNDQTVSAVGVYSPKSFNLRITQPWTQVASTLDLSGSQTKRESGEDVNTAKVQWGAEDDSLEVTHTYLIQDLRKSQVFEVSQPSSAFGYRAFRSTMEDDQSTPETYIFQTAFSLDDYEFDTRIRYTGDLPQPLGHHDLEVVITQPFFNAIPRTFTTKGVMTVLSSGKYESDWRIFTDGDDEIAALVKNYVPTDSGHTFSFLWRQAYYDVPFLRYVTFNSASSMMNDAKRVRGQLQIDAFPEMSFVSRTGASDDGEVTNKSINLALKTGPLSPYLMFRSLSVNSWYTYEEQGRRQIPRFYATLNLDDSEYHVDGNYNVKTQENDKRFIGDLNLQHPHDFELFGMRVPRSNQFDMKMIVKPMGTRLSFNYDNELIDAVQVVGQYRQGTGDRLLDSSVRIKYTPDAETDDISGGLRVVRNDNGYDRTLTFNFDYPASKINGQLILSGVNSDSKIGTEIILKNYDNVQRKLWKLELAYDKPTRVVTIAVNSPGMEEATLQGDLSQIIEQASSLVKTLANEAASTGLVFVKGMKPTVEGYDMYIGYQNGDEPLHTLHLIVGVNSEAAYALLEVKRDQLTQAKIGKVSVNLVDSRLVQIELKGYPVVTNFLNDMLSTCDNEVTRKINWLADQLISFLEACRSSVRGSDMVKAKMNLMIDQSIAAINSLKVGSVQQISNVISGTSNTFDRSQTVIQLQLKQAVRMLEQSINQIKATIAQPFTQIVDLHYGAFLRRVSSSIKAKFVPVNQLLAKVNADDVFVELIEEAVQKTSEFLLANGEALFVASRRPISELILVTDSEIVISIPLEFELEHFVPLPTMDQVKAWLAQTAFSVKVDKAMKQFYAYIDQYYQLRAIVYMPRDEILPPFKGHAFVSGFSHFSTFDKRHFDFISECPTTHVLVTDLRNNNFTVTMSYGDEPNNVLPSVEMIVENSKVVVYNDYTVQVNGQTKDMPVVVGKIAVTLEGQVVYIKHIAGDVSVGCDFKTELCTVEVSPYYFGSTGGLLGLFNNEPSDDFMAPNLSQIDDLSQFAASWESSGMTCVSGNAFRPCASNQLPKICESLFKSTSSPFRSCFPVVDPEEFMTMCQNYVCDSTSSGKSCMASAAYISRCALAGAPLTMPSNCFTCEDAHGHDFPALRTRGATVSGVDLVFVIQESSCMRRTGRAMRNFIKRVSTTLHSERLRDTRFYVVGYGGVDGSVQPHTYTLHSQPFTTKKKLLYKTIRKMKLSSEGTHQSDALAAISYASKLPFRAGAKPIIVLLSCDECNQDTSASYGDVEWRLKKHGISFHHLPHQEILAGRKSVFGFDGSRAYAKKDTDSSVIKASKTDSCVPLAAVAGSVWDARLMGDSAFQVKLSNYIAQDADVGSRVTCTCQVNDLGVATSVCTSSTS